MRYLPHIDGLRALAIIPVVLYHLYPSMCPGGFAGVDVFFVISGYLITGGIISDLDNREFSIASFYVRRIKRILPAYFAIIGFVLIATPLAYSFYHYSSICETALYSALYSANIYFADIISYFDVGARKNPLLHLWSLGVEEQFYLVIPVLLLLLWNIRKRFIIHNLVVLFIASFTCSLIAVGHGSLQFAFFMLPSRGWELLVGSIISQRRNLGGISHFYLAALSWLGLVLVLIPYGLYSSETPFPGLAAVPSTLGSALLIIYGNRAYLEKILTFRPFVLVGKVSYSLYLWHWPIFLFLGSGQTVMRSTAGVIVTVLATFLSYRYIEQPFRLRKTFQKRHAFGLLFIGSASIITFCLLIMTHKSKNGEVPSLWRDRVTWVKAEKSRDESRSACSFEELNATDSKFLIKIGNADYLPTFVLWGDSNALAILPGVDVSASKYGKSGYFINLKQSLTLDGDIGVFPFHPREDREPVIRWLESRPDIKDVFLVNRWFTQIRDEQDIEETLRICERLKKSGKNVFFFKNVPYANEKALRHLSFGFKVNSKTSATSLKDYETEAVLQNKLIHDLVTSGLAAVIPTDKAFLDGDLYYTSTDNSSFFVDKAHLNQAGAVRAMEFVAPLLW
ncbi:MAG: acyltransferase family protein [Chthoniobacteraceae bacterium]